MTHSRRLAVTALLGTALLPLAAGCGSGSKSSVTIERPKVWHLGSFRPAGSITPGKPVELTFRIVEPSGATLTRYRRGAGPHTGIHLIIVRDDLDAIIHLHPRIASDGVLRQKVVFAAPGRYRMVVDTYPNLPDAPPNFQLFRTVQVGSGNPVRPLPPYEPTVKTDGYTITIEGKPRLKAIEPAFLTVKIADAEGKPPRLIPFYGALAHAIFFRKGSLDYFHTHVCAPNAVGCSSLTRAPVGTSTTPGILHAGVLLPLPGTWRLFLQMELGGKIVTAPYTLHVT